MPHNGSHTCCCVALLAFISLVARLSSPLLLLPSTGDPRVLRPLSCRRFTRTAPSPSDPRSRGPLTGSGSWTAGQSDFGQYLIVDLGEKRNITSIASQGKPYTSEYVQEFRLDYGNDGQDFASYRDRNGNIKVCLLGSRASRVASSLPFSSRFS